MVKIITLALALSFSANIFAENVIFSEIGVKRLNVLFNSSENPFVFQGENLIIRHDDGRKEAVSTCEQFDKLIAEGFFASGTIYMMIEGNVKGYCSLKQFIGKMAVAKQSYLRPTRLDSALFSQFSPALAFDMSTRKMNAYENAAKEGKRWLEVFPNSKITSDGVHAVNVSLDDHTEMTFAVLIWADFNGDGIEDMLTFINGQNPGNKYQSSELKVLTRLNASAAVTEVHL